MKLLCSPEIFPEIIEIFEKNGIFPVKIPHFPVLNNAINHHPDILFSKLSDGSLLTDRGYFESEKDFFDSLGFEKIVLSESHLGPEYPHDVIFDAVKAKDFVIGKLDSVAKELLDDAKIHLDVRQGYAKCSVLLLENCAITSDKGIKKALESVGYEVLLITPGGVELPGYEYGFIGGASVFIEELKKVIFFGNIKAHPDGEKILDFIEKHGCSAEFPENVPLTDFGQGIRLAAF